MNEEMLLKELKKQTTWLKFLALPKLRKIFEENLTTKEQRRIYDLSDGKNSTNDISKKLLEEGIKVSHMTVYNHWKRWFTLGLVVPSEQYSGRFEKIIAIDEINI